MAGSPSGKGASTLSQSIRSTEENTPSSDPITISPTEFDHELLDGDAVAALRRLQDRGYQAYLVGGCVRDLLLGQRPKDFDIATSARPQHVKRCFTRNCRIIGRRFKLAHLHFDNNQKILEVSTFRRQPDGVSEDDDLLITRDNEFGTAREDAMRRDFTINALFLDPIRDQLIDYVGGIDDLQHRLIRTIGDPRVRLREDPVRILRAAKFSARLALDFEPATFAAMQEVSRDLVRSAPPRLLEEILRLLRGGNALESFQLLRDIGAIQVILPVVHDYLMRAPVDERILFWRTLEALDGKARRHADAPPGDWPPEGGLLLGALFNRPVQHEIRRDGGHSPTTVAEELITPFAQAFRLPRRDTGCLKRICGVQNRFTALAPKRFQTSSFLRDPFFEPAIDLFELTCIASGRDIPALERWRALEAELGAKAGDRARGEDFDRDDDIAEAGRDEDVGQRGDREEHRTRGRAGRRSRRSAGSGGGGAGGATDQRRRSARDARSTPDSKGSAGGRDARRAPARGPDKGRKAKARKRGERASERRGERRGERSGERASERRSQEVETIEPEAIDLTAFDVELDPKRVPTFGSIVEGSVKRKKRPILSPEDDKYRPPPPPGSDAVPPPPVPPTPQDDEFGDW